MAQAAADLALVDAMAEVWDSIAALGDGLDETEWKLETECPGWSVQDNVAHIVGHRVGDPRPAQPGAHPARRVARPQRRGARATRSGSTGTGRVPARRCSTSSARSPRCAWPSSARPNVDFDADAWTPIGPGTVRDMLPFRIFDSFVHEQDMRRAVGRPGWLGRCVPPQSRSIASWRSCRWSWASACSRPTAPGSTSPSPVPRPRVVAIEVEGGRARVGEARSEAPITRPRARRRHLRAAQHRTR